MSNWLIWNCPSRRVSFWASLLSSSLDVSTISDAVVGQCLFSHASPVDTRLDPITGYRGIRLARGYVYHARARVQNIRARHSRSKRNMLPTKQLIF